MDVAIPNDTNVANKVIGRGCQDDSTGDWYIGINPIKIVGHP